MIAAATAARDSLAFTMGADRTPMLHSATVIEFLPHAANGKRLVFAEQYAYRRHAEVRSSPGSAEELPDGLTTEPATYT